MTKQEDDLWWYEWDFKLLRLIKGLPEGFWWSVLLTALIASMIVPIFTQSSPMIWDVMPDQLQKFRYN